MGAHPAHFPKGAYDPPLSRGLSALTVVLWAFSQPVLPVCTDRSPLFAGWATILATAAGVDGFVRTVGATVDSLRSGRSTPG